MSANEAGGLTLRAKPEAPTRCPYCHEGVVQVDDLIACQACTAQHHFSCWIEEEGCSACGSLKGLGRVVKTPPNTRAENPEALVTYKNLIADLRKLLDTCMFRQAWLFLLPHLYIPIFWPILLINLNAAKRDAACMLEKIENVSKAYRFTATKREYLTLYEAEEWVSTGLCRQRT